MRILNPSHIKSGRFCENIQLLKPVKFFTQSSTLDVWWEPEFASGSIRDCFFELIDYSCIAQKMNFSIKGFFSKCDQIRRKLRIW